MNISLFFLINIFLFNYWCQISDQMDLLLAPFDKNRLLTDCSAQFCSTFCWTVLYWEVRISFYTTQKCVTSQFSFILIRSSYLPTWGTPWRKKDWHSYWRKWYFWCWIHHHHQKKKKRSVLKDMFFFHIDMKIHNKSWLLNALVEGRFVLGSAIRKRPCETWLDQDLETGRLLQIILRDP